MTICMICAVPKANFHFIDWSLLQCNLNSFAQTVCNQQSPHSIRKKCKSSEIIHHITQVKDAHRLKVKYSNKNICERNGMCNKSLHNLRELYKNINDQQILELEFSNWFISSSETIWLYLNFKQVFIVSLNVRQIFIGSFSLCFHDMSKPYQVLNKITNRMIEHYWYEFSIVNGSVEIACLME